APAIRHESPLRWWIRNGSWWAREGAGGDGRDREQRRAGDGEDAAGAEQARERPAEQRGTREAPGLDRADQGVGAREHAAGRRLLEEAAVVGERDPVAEAGEGESDGRDHEGGRERGAEQAGAEQREPAEVAVLEPRAAGAGQ